MSGLTNHEKYKLDFIFYIQIRKEEKKLFGFMKEMKNYQKK